MRANALRIVIRAALASAGLGLAASGASAHHQDAVATWHRDGRRPAGDQGGGTTGRVELWNKDARRPDGQDAVSMERRVEWWRIDDRRPAPWPKAGLDSDGDGVRDGADRCPDTPEGATVNDKGCPSDADGDWVPDGLDRCPDTPHGATVDAQGCPSDTDGDGVPDGIDRCPGTPRGTVVGANGCSKDSDGDGVPDDVDKCPDTPEGTRVDIRGCPVSGMEAELLDTGKLRLQNVYFDVNKATIKPESHKALDAAGEVLSKWPELRIEVGGHTDASGSDDYNQKLSAARAQAVLAYLTSKFSSLRKDQYTAKGYGESQPVATSETPEGRVQNRRVEFTVLNREVLRK